MLLSNRRLETLFGIVRFSLILLVLPILGCGEPKLPPTSKIEPPEGFKDGAGEWVQNAQGPTDDDNKLIGRFFENHPDLLGSPDWSGAPAKYQLKNSGSKTRFYWFHGSLEKPTWNALEVQGSSVEESSGLGLPGDANTTQQEG